MLGARLPRPPAGGGAPLLPVGTSWPYTQLTGVCWGNRAGNEGVAVSHLADGTSIMLGSDVTASPGYAGDTLAFW